MKTKFLILLFASALIIGCSKNEEENLTNQKDTRNNTNISSKGGNHDDQGETIDIIFDVYYNQNLNALEIEAVRSYYFQKYTYPNLWGVKLHDMEINNIYHEKWKQKKPRNQTLPTNNPVASEIDDDDEISIDGD